MIGFLNFPENYVISVHGTDGKGVTQPEKDPQIGGVVRQRRLVLGVTSPADLRPPGTPRSAL
jgi:hypothetical protein